LFGIDSGRMLTKDDIKGVKYSLPMSLSLYLLIQGVSLYVRPLALTVVTSAILAGYIAKRISGRNLISALAGSLLCFIHLFFLSFTYLITGSYPLPAIQNILLAMALLSFLPSMNLIAGFFVILSLSIWALFAVIGGLFSRKANIPRNFFKISGIIAILGVILLIDGLLPLIPERPEYMPNGNTCPGGYVTTDNLFLGSRAIVRGYNLSFCFPDELKDRVRIHPSDYEGGCLKIRKQSGCISSALISVRWEKTGKEPDISHIEREIKKYNPPVSKVSRSNITEINLGERGIKGKRYLLKIESLNECYLDHISAIRCPKSGRNIYIEIFCDCSDSERCGEIDEILIKSFKCQ